MKLKILIGGLAVVFGLGGCSAIEPHISKEYKVQARSIEKDFKCAEESISIISKAQQNWETKITKKDVSARVFETGDYDEWNRMWFRVKIKFYDDYIRIDVKGSGLYLKDLGVEKALNDFAPLLIKCLNKKD
ncbi:MAG: hypothetical protein PHV08_05845 [Sulfurovaceae bacterium]|nr:hypothetical protein [Sulfurovaceae bacterium]